MQGQREPGCHRGGTCSRVQSALFLIYLLLSHGTEQTWPTISQVCHVAVVPSAPQVPREKELKTGGHRLAMATSTTGVTAPDAAPQEMLCLRFLGKAKAACTRTRLHGLVTKGQNSAGFKQPANFQPPPSLSQCSRFPAPCCQIYGICTCKQQPVPPACVVTHPGHHLDVHGRFKAFPPGVLSYQAPDSTLTTFHNLLNP